MEESGSENESVREERRGSRISVEVVVACIGLIGMVIAAIIGLIGVLGAPVIAEFAESLFAPTATSVAVAPTPTPTPTTTTTPMSTSTSTLTTMPTSTATPTNAPTPFDTPTSTSTPLPSPTNTPTPTFTPSPSPTPMEDIRFWADSEYVSAGACIMVHWHVSNVNAYWIDGRPGAGDDGSFKTCPCQDETHTLRASKRDGSEVNLSVTINVSGQCEPEPIAPTCLITKPADGSENLGYENEVRATCSDVPDSLCVWILVYSHHDHNYYPQPGPIGRGSGQRMGTAWLGKPTEGIGHWFSIIVALADEAGSGNLHQYVEECSEDTQNCPGYDKLPGGVEEKARITVKRGHD